MFWLRFHRAAALAVTNPGQVAEGGDSTRRDEPMRMNASFFRRLWPFVKPASGRLALIGLLTLAQMAVTLLRPWPLQFAVDGLLAHKHDLPAWWFTWTMTWPDLAKLAAVCGALVMIVAAQGLLDLVMLYHSVKLGHGMVAGLRAALYQHLQKLSLVFHRRRRTGDLIKRLAVDTFSIQSLINSQFIPTLGAAVTVVLMFAIMLRMDWMLALVAMAVIPPLLLSIFRLSGRMEAVAAQAQEEDSKVYNTIEEGLNAMALVQALSQEPRQAQRFQKASDAGLAANLRLYLTQSTFSLLVDIITALGTAGLLYLGVVHVWQGRLTVGQLLVFLAYLASLYAPINTIVQSYSHAAESVAGLHRVFQILDVRPDVQDAPHPRPLSSARGRITLEKVWFGYEPGRPILRDLSLQIAPGEHLAVVGETGSGKTTLLGLLMRFYDPWQGRILLDGVDLREIRLRDLRAQNTLVLQDPILLATSVRDNLRFGHDQADDSAVQRAAGRARADGFIRDLPEGYASVLGANGMTLSGGQRQRLGVARAFLQRTPIFLLDEPTSALDVATEAELAAELCRHMRGCTTLMVTHRYSLARLADRVAVLRDGRVVEHGTPVELMAGESLYRRMAQPAPGAGDLATAMV